MSPLSANDNPYDRLATAGFTPAMSHEDVLDRALDLQAEERFTAEMRLAWDKLRLPPERLATDFLMMNLDAPSLDDRRRSLRDRLRRLFK